VLYSSLMRVQQLWESGEHSAERLKAAGRDEIQEENAVRLDYFEIVDTATLDAVEDAPKGALVAVAAFVGNTRLIDNIVV
jgi:pantothenate synthetase